MSTTRKAWPSNAPLTRQWKYVGTIKDRMIYKAPVDLYKTPSRVCLVVGLHSDDVTDWARDSVSKLAANHTLALNKNLWKEVARLTGIPVQEGPLDELPGTNK